MKTKLFSLAIIIAFTAFCALNLILNTGCGENKSSVDSTSIGLIAYYPFNGNANDESGNGHNGTVNGATLTTDRFGNKNSAYSFDGSGAFISLDGTVGNFGTSDFSISAWIKGVSFPSSICQQPIFSNRYGGDPDWFTFGTHDGKLDIEIYASTGTGASYKSNSSLTTGTWYNVLLTRKKDSVSMYINGQLDNFAVCSTPADLSSSVTSQIGTYNCVGSSFDGVIDDIRIYRRALSKTEITNLYNNTPVNKSGNTSQKEPTKQAQDKLICKNCGAEYSKDKGWTVTGISNGDGVYYKAIGGEYCSGDCAKESGTEYYGKFLYRRSAFDQW